MKALAASVTAIDRPRVRSVATAYLRRCLERRGATITAAAVELGISRKHLSNILGGRATLEEPLLTQLCRVSGADPALIRPLAVQPGPPASSGHGALAGSVQIVGDVTEPIGDWETAPA
jgi:transcriptional regulator with XRE-family HTH domain